MCFWSDDPLEISKYEAYKNYVYWCEFQMIKPETNRKLGRSIKKLLPSVDIEKRLGSAENKKTAYEFPPITKARQEFEDAYKAIGCIPWKSKDLGETQDKIVLLETT